MLSQSCLQPSWSPPQLPRGWGHRGSTAVPGPWQSPAAAVPLAGATGQEAAGLVSGDSGARGRVRELGEQARGST